MLWSAFWLVAMTCRDGLPPIGLHTFPLLFHHVLAALQVLGEEYVREFCVHCVYCAVLCVVIACLPSSSAAGRMRVRE